MEKETSESSETSGRLCLDCTVRAPCFERGRPTGGKPRLHSRQGATREAKPALGSAPAAPEAEMPAFLRVRGAGWRDFRYGTPVEESKPRILVVADDE